MEDAPVEKLRGMIQVHGRGIVVEPAKCAALLRDYCGEHRREASVLIGALNEGIPARLIQSETSAGTVAFSSLGNHLQQSAGFSDEAARWAVHAWSSALGIKERVSSSSNALPVLPSVAPVPPPLPQESPEAQYPVYTAPPVAMPSREFVAPAVSPTVLPIDDTASALRWIRWTWYVALVCAGYSTFVGLLIVSEYSPAPWIFLAVVQNALALVAMGFGVLQRSRLCAILLLSYHVLGTLGSWMQFPTSGFFALHKIGILAFLFFYGKGIQATFALHDMDLRRRP